jgi:deoxyribonuclease-1
MKILLRLLISTLITTPVFADNQEVQSFSKAKRALEKQAYNNHRITLYCNTTFDAKKRVKPSRGFTTTKYIKRAKKVE